MPGPEDASPAGPSGTGARPALLCLAKVFSPSPTPTAIRATQLLDELAERWEITLLTETAGPRPAGRVRVQEVRGWRPARLLAALRRAHLDKLLEWLVWPDESVFWVLPAVLAARRLARQTRPSAIVVFMMPYSAGLAGVLLRRLTGLPLLLNLDDSPTCSDMHPHFPSRLHFRAARALEDLYVRRADAVVYVSQTNLDLVAARQPRGEREKLRLVRYGAAPIAAAPSAAAGGPAGEQSFEIVYVGAMSGWWSLLGEQAPRGRLGRLYDRWTRLGRYQQSDLDHRTSSPAIVGRAVLEVLAQHPDWAGRVRCHVYGNPYPPWLVERALQAAGVAAAVNVEGPLPHERIPGILAAADMLFLTLPKRLDDLPGGRISAKTYEYLASDRPILAAVSGGENRDYLAGKPGVWLVEPDDHATMAAAIEQLAGAKFAGSPVSFDRSGLYGELSYRTRAREFDEAIAAAISHRATAGR